MGAKTHGVSDDLLILQILKSQQYKKHVGFYTRTVESVNQKKRAPMHKSCSEHLEFPDLERPALVHSETIWICSRARQCCCVHPFMVIAEFHSPSREEVSSFASSCRVEPVGPKPAVAVQTDSQDSGCNRSKSRTTSHAARN